jgi:hypothetical protein
MTITEREKLLNNLRVQLIKALMSFLILTSGAITMGIALADLLPLTTPVCGHHIMLILSGLCSFYVFENCRQDWFEFRHSLPDGIKANLPKI